MGHARISLGLVAALLGSGLVLAVDAQDGRTRVLPESDSSGCVACHAGIEPMHAEAELSCVDCHGGDGEARSKSGAHVSPLRPQPADERVPELEGDFAYRRFVNPMDLRVAEATCGSCHARLVEHFEFSLHGTTSGHLSDGYYEVGLQDERQSRYAVFPVNSFQTSEGSVDSLAQVPAFRHYLPEEELGKHFSDVARKECMQCHFYSPGRAVRGRVGFDGDYRGSGCAACHVPYAADGLSDSADRQARRSEPGHPARHELRRTPPTEACVTCHYGDASLGMHFRGLSQLPPGAPGGPDIAGTTDSLQNRAFYLNDPELCPPDLHHERGMHCVDCHTLGDVMGDGALHGKMEQQVEISCEACHGNFEERSALRTERGTPLDHLHAEGERVFLTSKVTGRVHEVPQVREVLDPASPRYNERAVHAMTSEHESLECYACHAGWNVNFLGFHFDRNESLTQLDLLSGKRTPGRVTTQEKVFATWKSFYAGLNEHGRLAPYMTGFSTMGSVSDAEGTRILDQVLPETARGLSGLTMIHHQTHSVRPEARSCVECHRSPQTFGLGSVNFRLARQLAFVADRRGIEVLALDRGQLAASVPLAKLVLPDVIDLALDCDDLQGHARYLYAAEGGRGVHVIDVRDPAHPRRIAFVASVRPRGLVLSGDHLYLADGEGGLVIYDVTQPEAPRLVSRSASFDAHDVQVQWPWAYLADGVGGLAIYDVRAPLAPRLLSSIALGPVAGESLAIDLSVLFQYSRPPREGETERTPARNLCAITDEVRGLVLVDVTEPTAPVVLYPDPRARTGTRSNRIARGVILQSHVDLAEAQGGSKTTERDYAYVLAERLGRNGQSNSELQVIDISEPTQPRRVGRHPLQGSTEMVRLASFYNAPFLQTVLFVAGEDGVQAVDASLSTGPTELATLPYLASAYAIAVEEFPLDAMRDPSGRALKDVSHEPSRWLYLSEIERLLGVSARALGLVADDARPPLRAETARLLHAQQDANGDTFLSGNEVSPAMLGSADASGDGRVSLLELARAQGLLGGRETAAPPDSVFLESRVTPDGDLARLFDGIDPFAFDKDDDLRLSRTELERAAFAALDLDGDRRLSRDEMSRYPRHLRQLRYRDAATDAQWRALDSTRDGSLDAREFDLLDEEWEAIDVDADGYCQLPYDLGYWERRLQGGPVAPEWPRRRGRTYPLPPGLTLERLLEALDRDEDGALTTRELKRRRDLLPPIDTDTSAILEPDELERALGQLARTGVDASPDGFEARWDLDGNGKVEEAELPVPAGQRARLSPR